MVAIERGRDVDIKSEVKLPSIYSLHLAWPGDADIAVPAQLDMRRVRGIALTPGSGPVRGNADLDTEGRPIAVISRDNKVYAASSKMLSTNGIGGLP